MNIFTLTLSPAVDVEYRVKSISGGTNRAYDYSVSFGGKGINVSRALARCLCGEAGPGSPYIYTIFPYGGSRGKLLYGGLAAEGLDVSLAIEVTAETRVNVSIIPDEGESIEVNALGSAVAEGLRLIEERLLSSIKPGDVVCVCGSVPSDVGRDYPALLGRKLKDCGAIVVLDCDGLALEHASKEESFSAADLIKPNSAEMESLVGRKIHDLEEFRDVCASLPFGSVIMTMGGAGAMYYGGGESFMIPVQKRVMARLKGAGDVFLGAYICKRYIVGCSACEAMRFAAEFAGDYVAGKR